MVTPESVNPSRLVQRSFLLVATALALLPPGLCRAADDPPAAAISSEPAFTLIKLDGIALGGHLRRLESKSGVSLVDEKGNEQTVPIADLMKLARDEPPSSPPSQGGMILFPDGDRLHRVNVRKASDTELDVQSFGLESLKIPLDSIVGLIPVAPLEASAASALVSKIRETPRTEEMLWLSNGDRLSGGFVGFGEKTVKFRPATGAVELNRESVVALGFDPSLVTYPRPSGVYLEVALIDGTRLGLGEFKLEGAYLNGRTRFGSTLKIPTAEIVGIQARTDSLRFLSDVPALQDRYRDYIGPTRPYRRDSNVLGGPIRIQGRTYEHGIGTQPRTLLAYRLDSGWARFRAVAGLDDQAGPLANVVFRVVVDGKELGTSPPLATRDTPYLFDIDIRGAKTLVLITEFGERGNVQDIADWGDARLTR